MMKCWQCGGTFQENLHFYYRDGEYIYYKDSNNPKRRCFCENCFNERRETLDRENEQFLLLKRKRMFETAIEKLENQGIDLWKYKEAIDTVQEYNEQNADRFDSSYEIIAAIILIYNGIKIKMQQKVGKYQVDFLLPNEHIVLEIDGMYHKMDKVKSRDSLRDYEIKKALGQDWEIIRISTNCLDMKAEKLVGAMDKILDYRLEKRIAWEEN